MEFEINETRINRKALYIRTAGLFSLRATCNRLKVGAVAVSDGRIIATGYNGSLPYEAHCTDGNCNAENPCMNTIHAEANLIAYAARKGIALENADLYCTHQPCIKCAELIISAGIVNVFFKESYRLVDGLSKLMTNGIKVERINEQGITQWI